MVEFNDGVKVNIDPVGSVHVSFGKVKASYLFCQVAAQITRTATPTDVDSSTKEAVIRAAKELFAADIKGIAGTI